MMSGPGTTSKDKPLIQSKLSFTSIPSTSTGGKEALPGSNTDTGKGNKRKMDDEVSEQEKRCKRAEAAEGRFKAQSQMSVTNSEKESEEPVTSSSHKNGSSEMATDEKAATSASTDDKEEPAGETQRSDMSSSQEYPPTDSDNLNDSQNSVMDISDHEVEDGFSRDKPGVLNADCPGKGTPINHLKTAPKDLPSDLDLGKGDSHDILIKLPFQYQKNSLPVPFPPNYVDYWDTNHVRMPCSNENVYPVEDGKSEVTLRKRWDLIQESLLDLCDREDIGPLELEAAIIKYNQRYAIKWRFSALQNYFTNHVSKNNRDRFFKETLPKMVRLALKLPIICTKPIPLLKKGKPKKLTLSQQQIASLLANAFFCTFPRRNARSRHAEFSQYPDINFNKLFEGFALPRKMGKMDCIIHYFERVTKDMPKGIVTFSRQILPKSIDWRNDQSCLTRLHVSSSGTIEDNGIGMLQVDFANKFIGGGVLGHGCVQEEIRFMICPEMIITRLFTEALNDMESLIMTGCEQFSKYKGYADSFCWDGNFVDQTKRDSVGRLCCEVVAIDALLFRSPSDSHKQFKLSSVQRELNKAYSGFMSTMKEVNKTAVCTGNWGCGAFGGDKHLKSLIQLMAAAVAKRDVCYFTFEDKKLTEELHEIHTLLGEEDKTIGEIMKLVESYNKEVINRAYSKRAAVISLFEFIKNKLGVDHPGSRGSGPNPADFEEDSREGLEMHKMDSKASNMSPDYRAATP